MNRTIVYLHDGRAWIAELEDGRAQVSPLVAWMSAHPGRSARRSLVTDPPRPPKGGRVRAPWRGRVRAALAAVLGRLLGGRAPAHPHPDVRAGC